MRIKIGEFLNMLEAESKSVLVPIPGLESEDMMVSKSMLIRTIKQLWPDHQDRLVNIEPAGANFIRFRGFDPLPVHESENIGISYLDKCDQIHSEQTQLVRPTRNGLVIICPECGEPNCTDELCK